MYGYLRPNTAETSPDVSRRYRRYYCALCHALWNHYGQKARLMVSYDMAFAAVVLSSRFALPAEKNKCLKKAVLPETEDNWKKLAALSVILAAGKLEDDIGDDRSMKARLGRLLMRRTIRKAKRDYPDAYRAVAEEMARFHRMEDGKRDAAAMADCFSEVMAKGVTALFPDLNRKEEAIMRYVTAWVYLIDAVDDLDEDLRKHTPNPFAATASSREELLTHHGEEIRRLADEHAGRIRSVLLEEDFSTAEDLVIAAVICGTIPETTARVFSLIPGYPRAAVRPPRKRGGVLYG